MPDFNMISARLISMVLFKVSYRPQYLPNSLQDVENSRVLVEDMNNIIGRYIESFSLSPKYVGQINSFPDIRFHDMLNEITEISRNLVQDIQNDLARSDVALCLWSGCLIAAKGIAKVTMDGGYVN